MLTIKENNFIQVFGRFMTEEECSENLDLQKEIGVIFQPGGKGQVNRSIIATSETEIYEKKETMKNGFVSIDHFRTFAFNLKKVNEWVLHDYLYN